MCVLSLECRALLTFPFQKELATNANEPVSVVRHNIPKIPEDTCSQNRMVSITRTILVTERPLTLAQTYARLAIITTYGSNF